MCFAKLQVVWRCCVWCVKSCCSPSVYHPASTCGNLRIRWRNWSDEPRVQDNVSWRPACRDRRRLCWGTCQSTVQRIWLFLVSWHLIGHQTGVNRICSKVCHSELCYCETFRVRVRVRVGQWIRHWISAFRNKWIGTQTADMWCLQSQIVS